MSWTNKYKDLAKKALSKPAEYGEDIDISQFTMYRPEKDKSVLEDAKDLLEAVGIDISEESRSGSFYQLESQVLKIISKQPGLELMTIDEALDRYGKDLDDFYWKALNVDKDKYTALVELKRSGGYFIRVKKGYKVAFPVQACLLMEMNKSLQALHNIVIAEEGSEVSLVVGCAAMRENVGLHVDATEIYIEENARVNYVMIHRWNEAMHIRSRTGVVVGRNGNYVSNYIAFTKLRTFQSMPVINIYDHGKAYLSSIIALEGDAKADSGYHARLLGEEASAQIISRSITKDQSNIITRAIITGENKGVKGHIDCQGLLLSKSSRILTIPILDAFYDDVVLTHEAAVGRLAEDKILWLVARGFSRDEAESILVKGFMRTDLPELPKSLRAMIDATLNQIAKAVL